MTPEQLLAMSKALRDRADTGFLEVNVILRAFAVALEAAANAAPAPPQKPQHLAFTGFDKDGSIKTEPHLSWDEKFYNLKKVAEDALRVLHPLVQREDHDSTCFSNGPCHICDPIIQLERAMKP